VPVVTPVHGNWVARLDDMRGMRTNITTTRPRRAVAVGLFAFGAAACGDDSTNEAADTTAAANNEELGITGQWARTSPMDATNGAAYFTVVSSGDDRLTGVKVDASVAGMAQIHETVMVTDDTMAMGSDTTMAMGGDTTMAMGGEMEMREVEGIDVVAGEPLVLEPGGYHVMLMELAAPLEVGTSISLTLTFEKAGDIVVDVPVLDEAP
jgi:periplasmic copper chaperone A